MSNLETDIVIVGAGISGMTCAHMLSKKNQNFIILDSASDTGGNIKSVEKDSFLMELGPNSFLASAQDIWDLIEDLDIEDELTKSYDSAHNRFIYRNNLCQKVPTSIWGFITTRLFSFKTKLLILTEPFRLKRGSSEDSAETFFTRRFGKEFTDIVISSFVSGIYAGNIAKLHAKSAFPLLWSFEQKYGSMIRGAIFQKKTKKSGRSGIWSFKKGLQTITNKITKNLSEKVRVNTTVESITKANGKYHLKTNGVSIVCNKIVLASPPATSSKFLQNLSPKASEILDAIPLAPIVVLHVSTRDIDKIPSGFGMLIPRSEGVETLGVLFSSKTFPDRAPEGSELLTIFIGGTFNEKLIQKSEADIISTVTKDLKVLLDIDQVTPLKMTKWNASIPQLILNHDLKMRELLDEVSLVGNIHLCGNYLTGVGIKDAVSSAKRVADKL